MGSKPEGKNSGHLELVNHKLEPGREQVKSKTPGQKCISQSQMIWMSLRNVKGVEEEDQKKEEEGLGCDSVV